MQAAQILQLIDNNVAKQVAQKYINQSILRGGGCVPKATALRFKEWAEAVARERERGSTTLYLADDIIPIDFVEQMPKCIHCGRKVQKQWHKKCTSCFFSRR